MVAARALRKLLNDDEIGEVTAVLLSTIAAIALILLMAVSASAHEDGERLASKNPVTGEGCCGRGACREVRGVVRVTWPGNGWHIPPSLDSNWLPVYIPEAEAIPQDDAVFTVCKHNGKITCFFYPRLTQ